MEYVVQSFVQKLPGSAGTSGTDLEALQGWLLKFGDHSKKLWVSVESFMDWMSNKIPPWAIYWSFMSVHLIVLYKLPGVHPVGVRETWRQIFAKCVLKVMVPEATHACNDDQLCTLLKAVTDGYFMVFNLFGMLTIPRKIGVFYFLMQRMPLMRLIESKCCGWFDIYGLLGLIFFNCYRRHSSLDPRNRYWMSNIRHSTYGVTQG